MLNIKQKGTLKRLTTYDSVGDAILKIQSGGNGYYEELEEEETYKEAVNVAIQRLAKYENTGLDPEGIAAIIMAIVGKKDPRPYSLEEAKQIIKKPNEDTMYWMQWYNQQFLVKDFRDMGNGKIRYQRFGDIGEKRLEAYGRSWLIWTGKPRDAYVIEHPLKRT